MVTVAGQLRNHTGIPCKCHRGYHERPASDDVAPVVARRVRFRGTRAGSQPLRTPSHAGFVELREPRGKDSRGPGGVVVESRWSRGGPYGTAARASRHYAGRDVITLVLGGARSGKSALAERIAERLSPEVTYVATGVARSDENFAERIAQHQSRRPATWVTVETGRELAAHVRTLTGTVLVDSLGTWLAGHEGFVVELDELIQALLSRVGDTVLVSEEVGLGVHPSTALGGEFRDALGRVNQRVADVADSVLFVVAGRVLTLERGPW